MRPVLLSIRSSLALAVAAAAAACGPTPQGAEPTPADIAARYPHDDGDGRGFRANPDFVPVEQSYGVIRRSLSLEGEILVVEGDAETVTVGGPGSFGITEANQIAIVQQVLDAYPDVFDTIQIYTSFVDAAHAGEAYYEGLRNDVSGIGLNQFNRRADYGLPPETGRLSGFSNMNSLLMWGNDSFDGLNTVEGAFHAEIAHQLAHRWLFRMRFNDSTGNPSDALIGRDDRNWSRLAQADGSVLDGNLWVDNGDGTFTNMGTDLGFAPLDLYAMGRLRASAVPDLFYLFEATLDGMEVDKLSNFPRDAVVQATRGDVTMDQVLAAMGDRNPPASVANPYYRAAFVLVTAPGQAREDWQPHLDALQDIGADFPQTWRNWTGGGMCTSVTERCPEPVLAVADAEVTDDNDGIAGPGEQVRVRVSVQNTGVGVARGARARLTAASGGVTVDTTDALAVPEVPQGTSAALSQDFLVTVGADVECAQPISFNAVFETEEGPVFTSSVSLNVGTRVVRSDPLNEAPNWTVDPDNRDNALRGAWEFGEPELVTVLGRVTQPGEDHTPGDGKLSFHTGLAEAGFFAENDLDGGTTTLESPVFDLSGTLDPILVFYAWHNVGDFTQQGGPGPLEGSDLIVQVSNDGGGTYEELGRVVDSGTDWQRVALRVRDAVVPSGRVRFRFVITDESEVGNVEAGVDDLEIIDFVEGCDIEIPGNNNNNNNNNNNGGGPPPEEGGCRATGRAGGALVGLWLLFGAGLARRRRR